MKDKKILAIETSGELCSVSLSYDINKYDERSILMKHVHSEKLIPMIDEILESNTVLAKDLYSIAVSVGPGSFTGLRIGMTAAKGIAFAANLSIIPVPTFDALSLEISEYISDDISICILNNANIDECYYAKYSIKNGEIQKLVDVKLLKKIEIDDEFIKDNNIYGNLKGVEGVKSVTSPRASSLAKWAYLFGEDLLTFKYDYLEPNYLKNFVVRKNK